MFDIQFSGQLPENFESAFSLLQEDLRLRPTPGGYPVTFVRGENPSLVMTPEGATLTYQKTVACYRGLSLLSQHFGQTLTISLESAFPTLGVVFELCSNAVLTLDTMKFFFRKMAQLGFDLGMMITVDTYEVPELPYVGYLRGKYSQQDLRELDDYAYLLGIELCPCIQTLAHLNRILHWPEMAHLKDTEEVLLLGYEPTYDFIRTMLKAASAPFRSKRIHIGMDEAHSLGQGQYLRLHGYRAPFELMKEHLSRVSAITRELGLEPMMWSDMYFRPASPTGGYYDSPGVPQDLADAAPRDISLLYWDYYHEDEASYHKMFEKHAPFGVPIGFCGGIWTWLGPAPHYKKTLDTTLPALRQARAHHVDLVFCAAWGDNGAECSKLASLYGLAIYSEFNYTGDYDAQEVGDRFRAVMGADPQAFLDLTRLNQLPGVKDWSLRPVNAAKFLLLQDPLVPLFEYDLAGVDMASHYESLVPLYARYQEENPEFALFFSFYRHLAETLAVKCRFHQLAGPAVRAGDREAAERCVSIAKEAQASLESLRALWRELWYSTNRAYGFEIIDIRMGGLVARMESAAKMLEDYVLGRIPTVNSLAEEPLPYTVLPDGALRGSYAWGEIASACKLDI